MANPNARLNWPAFRLTRAAVASYGHPRLAWANVQGTSATFVRWVPQNELTFAQIQGERQRGGINAIGASQWQGSVPRPTGADDAAAP